MASSNSAVFKAAGDGIGGHLAGLASGGIFYFIQLPYSLEYALVVALAIFLMVALDVEHPPATVGDELVLDLPAVEPGKYEVFVNLTKAVDYGIARFYLNETKLGDPLDLYNPSVITTGSKSLGKITLKSGPLKFRVKIVGANPNAEKRHMVGLDYIKLAAQ